MAKKIEISDKMFAMLTELGKKYSREDGVKYSMNDVIVTLWLMSREND